MNRIRQFDLVIFGATGFTGRKLVATAARLCTNISWGIAGRNPVLLEELAAEHGGVPVIVATIEDPGSLRAMASKTNVLLNAVGPYRQFGEPVLKACIEGATHLIDLCGEPEFLEKAVIDYDNGAKEAGVLIIQSCGMDSLPADVGQMVVRKEFEPEGWLTHMDTFLKISGGAQGYSLHSTTYEAAVMGFSNQESLKALRQRAARVKLNLAGPRPQVKSGPFKDPRQAGRSCYLFPGADASVMKRTQELLTKEDPDFLASHIGCYFTIEDGIVNNAKMLLFGGTFQTLARYERGRQLLFKYPEFFSNGYFTKQGPTDEQLRGANFAIDFFGMGYSNARPALDALRDGKAVPQPDKKVAYRLTGPDPGYIATSSMAVIACLALLNDRDSLPKAGVLTPGFAFRKSQWVLEKLRGEGIEIQKQQATAET